MRWLPTLLIFSALFSGARSAFPAAAAWYQDELVKRSDVIAIVEIHERMIPAIGGSILSNGEEYPTALILYASNVIETLWGA